MQEPRPGPRTGTLFVVQWEDTDKDPECESRDPGLGDIGINHQEEE